jgi:hypothetical protein
VLHDRELTGQLYRYDPDGDAITVPIVSSPSVFSAQLISAPTNGTVVLSDDGRFRYTPAAGYTGTDAFVFGFTDGIALGLAVAWIVVHNTAPEAVNDEYYVLAGSAVRGNVLANDTDADGDSLRVVKINDQPLRQLMQLPLQLPSGAQLVMNPNGDFAYYPAADHTGDDSFTYTVSDGVAEATQTVVVHTAKILGIRSVTFRGGHTVYRDPELDPTGAIAPDVAYSSEHWLDTNLDGDAEDAGEHSWPYAYTRGTTLKVSARFVLDTAWGGGPIYVMATGPTDPATGFQIHVGPKAVRVDPTNPNELVLDETESPVAFPNVVQAYVGANLFRLDWQATSDSQRANSTWTKAGTTQNPLYLTFADPALKPGVNLYHTLVHLGSKNADGKANESDVISAIWSDFTDREVRRVDHTQLRYWAGGRATAVNTRELLAHANGQCGSWAYFLRDIMLAQGITDVKRVHVFNIDEPVNAAGRPMTPDGLPAETRILVKNWRFGTPTSPATKPYIYRSTDVTELRGVPGQGNDDPLKEFRNHFIVRLKGQYYDPSYGTGPFATQNAWENASLDGFGEDRFGGTFYKKNDPKRIETRFVEL